MAAYIDTVVSLLIITGLIGTSFSQIELDERFLMFRKEGMWLVKFYAPWCGHCKKLEPVFRDVAKELESQKSKVRVAKIDCTRFPSVGAEFSVKGFPTIIFFHGDAVFHHHGDRTKEDLLEFVGRAQGPTVRKLSSEGKFKEATRRHEKTVFFLYLGDDDEKEDLFQKYSYAAETNTVNSYFYYGPSRILGTKAKKLQRQPTLLVFKDGDFTEFEPPRGFVSASALDSWISRERYATFPRLSGPGLNDVARTAKLLVILAVDPDEMKNTTSHNARVFDTTKQVALKYKSKREYQFLWMDEVDTIQSIAVAFLTPPVLLVLDPSNQLYYTTPSVNLTRPLVLEKLLERVVNGEETAFGGTGILMRIQRMLFDLLTTVISIWQASRLLFCLMFGLPTLVISIVCYSLCCMETVDDIKDEFDEDDEDEDGYGEELPPPPALEGSAQAADRDPPTYAEAVDGDFTESKPVQDKKDD